MTLDFETWIKRQHAVRIRTSFKDVLSLSGKIAVFAAAVMLALQWESLPRSARLMAGLAWSILVLVFAAALMFDMRRSVSRQPRS